MDRDALRPRPLAPTNLASWAVLCERLATAVGKPGLVVLVGPEGSGKTYALKALYLRLNVPGAYRTAGQTQTPGIRLDLVDEAALSDAEALAGDTDWPGTRVVALRTEDASLLLRLRPDARIVTVQPMTRRDVDVMLDDRCKQTGLRTEDFTRGARAALRSLCDRNPRKVDRLFGCSLAEAIDQGADAVGDFHVIHAARILQEEYSSASFQGDPSTASTAVSHEAAALVESLSQIPQSAVAFVPSDAKEATASSETPPARQTPIIACAATARGEETPEELSRQRNGPAWDALYRSVAPAEIARLATANIAAPRRRTLQVTAALSALGGMAVLAGMALAMLPAKRLPDRISAEATGPAPQSNPSRHDASQEIPPTPGGQGIPKLAELPQAEDPVQRLEPAQHATDRTPNPPQSQPLPVASVEMERPPSGQQVPRTQLPRDQAKAERLMKLGRTLAAIGQQEDAQAMFTVAAALGGGQDQGQRSLSAEPMTTHR